MKSTRKMSHKYKENDKQMAPGLDWYLCILPGHLDRYNLSRFDLIHLAHQQHQGLVLAMVFNSQAPKRFSLAKLPSSFLVRLQPLCNISVLSQLRQKVIDQGPKIKKNELIEITLRWKQCIAMAMSLVWKPRFAQVLDFCPAIAMQQTNDGWTPPCACS